MLFFPRIFAALNSTLAFQFEASNERSYKRSETSNVTHDRSTLCQVWRKETRGGRKDRSSKSKTSDDTEECVAKDSKSFCEE
jgi:hypothetical protein